LTGPLRIAMVAACPFPLPRGTPIRIHRLAEALARRGHDVHVVAYHLGEELRDPPFRVHRIAGRWLGLYRKTSPGPSYRKLAVLDPLLARELSRCIESCRIDLVHAHHYEGLIVGRLVRRRGVPVVYDAHTTLETELPYHSVWLPSFLKRGIGRFLDRRLPPLADHTIAVSEGVRERLLRAGADPASITVVVNGVEAEAFQPPGNERPDAGTVIFTGNLAPYQRIDLLLEAFSRVRARRPDARLVIVTGSSFEPYAQAARDLGISEGLVLRDEPFERIPALLAGAEVAVSPRADGDGVPQKILNYMAAGKAIAAFRGSAGPLEDERTGLCAESGSAEALAGAILRLLEDRTLARRLGDAAREEVIRHRSWDAAAARVEEVYARLLAERPAAEPGG